MPACPHKLRAELKNSKMFASKWEEENLLLTTSKVGVVRNAHLSHRY